VKITTKDQYMDKLSMAVKAKENKIISDIEAEIEQALEKCKRPPFTFKYKHSEALDNVKMFYQCQGWNFEYISNEIDGDCIRLS
jgi:hypothetical protein